MGLNAMTDEDKERRRQTLLDAAHGLFRERRDLPPVADIAKAAGLAKGTVYLYFSSKEEIFIALLEDDFSKLFDELANIIAELPTSTGDASRQFARVYAELVLGLEDLLPLASLANGVLEQNLPVDVMRRFKTMLATRLVTAGRQLEMHFAALEPGEGLTLLLQTYALTLGLWQALNYPTALREMLKEAALKPLDRHFAVELEVGISNLWLGTLARS